METDLAQVRQLVGWHVYKRLAGHIRAQANKIAVYELESDDEDIDDEIDIWDEV